MDRGVFGVYNSWDREYHHSRFVTCDSRPTAAFTRFLKYIKKKRGSLEGKTILDVGCGTGRHSYYCAERGARVVGLDISPRAVEIARGRYTDRLSLSGFGRGQIKQLLSPLVTSIAGELRSVVSFPEEGSCVFLVHDIRNSLLVLDRVVDLVLDLTSSVALTYREHEYYLREVFRILKPGGLLCVRSLKLDGDTNAKKLLKDSPGPEEGTYVLPKSGLVERPDSREYVTKMYNNKNFQILTCIATIGYSNHGGIVYKRCYWEILVQKCQ